MTNRMAVLGLVLAILGTILAVAFWPMISMSGAQLLAARSGNDYPGYNPGARVLVHERVIRVTFSNAFGSQYTFLELDDGNPNQDTVIFVRGDARSLVANNSVIYASAVLQSVFGVEYWEVATPADVQPSWPVDALFYGIAGLGVALLAWTALRAPRATPPKG